jgi:uncharacterized membrane protein YkoI
MKKILPLLLLAATTSLCSLDLAVAGSNDEATLKAKAKVTEADARKIALAKVPGGTVKSSEIEKENGLVIWTFDITRNGSDATTEVNVDAATGKVVAMHNETAAYEKKEGDAETKSDTKK